MANYGYIVKRNGLSVHYFVSNIYLLKVITYSIYTLRGSWTKGHLPGNPACPGSATPERLSAIP